MAKETIPAKDGKKAIKTKKTEKRGTSDGYMVGKKKC